MLYPLPPPHARREVCRPNQIMVLPRGALHLGPTGLVPVTRLQPPLVSHSPLSSGTTVPHGPCPPFSSQLYLLVPPASLRMVLSPPAPSSLGPCHFGVRPTTVPLALIHTIPIPRFAFFIAPPCFVTPQLECELQDTRSLTVPTILHLEPRMALRRCPGRAGRAVRFLGL